MKQPKHCVGCRYSETKSRLLRSNVIWHHICKKGTRPTDCCGPEKQCENAIPDGHGSYRCRKDEMSCVHPYGPCYGKSDEYMKSDNKKEKKDGI